MMINDSSLFYWRWKSLLFNALWRHILQRRHIRNRLIRVRKGCTFYWCIDCEKYCCLICRGWKLLGWPSYTICFSRPWRRRTINILGSRFWPLGVTWRHRSCDHRTRRGHFAIGGQWWPWSCTDTDIWGLLDFGVTSLTTWGHVTSSATWPF